MLFGRTLQTSFFGQGDMSMGIGNLENELEPAPHVVSYITPGGVASTYKMDAEEAARKATQAALDANIAFSRIQDEAYRAARLFAEAHAYAVRTANANATKQLEADLDALAKMNAIPLPTNPWNPNNTVETTHFPLAWKDPRLSASLSNWGRPPASQPVQSPPSHSRPTQPAGDWDPLHMPRDKIIGKRIDRNMWPFPSESKGFHAAQVFLS